MDDENKDSVAKNFCFDQNPNEVRTKQIFLRITKKVIYILLYRFLLKHCIPPDFSVIVSTLTCFQDKFIGLTYTLAALEINCALLAFTMNGNNQIQTVKSNFWRSFTFHKKIQQCGYHN